MSPHRFEPPEHQLPFFRALRTALDNPMEGWPRAVYEQLVYEPPRRDFRAIYICDPDLLRVMMLERVDAFPKSQMQARLLRPLLGDGVMTAEGAHWRWQRHAAAPAFQARRIGALAPSMASVAEDAVSRWRGGAPVIEATEEMIRITFEIILDTMLAGRNGVDLGRMSDAIGVYLNQIGRPSIADLLGAPNAIRRLVTPQSNRAVAYLRGEIDKMIARRRAAPRVDDLFDLLMRSVDPTTGRAMGDAELRDNLLTFWAAGHETTAVTLTWALHLIANDPAIGDTIAAEVAREIGDREINARNAEKLTFTKQVILETMRLFPPVPLMSRNCVEDITIGARNFRKGDVIVIPVYALHRHRAHWDFPDEFLPERFAPSTDNDKRKFVFMPFGAGPRICIGAAFATLEAIVVLATLMRRMRVAPLSTVPIRPLFRITMRPAGGLPLSISPRDDIALQHEWKASSHAQ